jgi:hypothetical protein
MAVVTILSSATAGHVPSSLVQGQIAINTADGILFWLDSDGVTIESLNLFMGGSPPSNLNTLQKLATAINNDPSFYSTINGQILSRLRFDAAQSLGQMQIAQALNNIGLTSQDIALALANIDYKAEGGEEGAI